MGLPAADAAPRRERRKVIPTSTPSRRWFRGVKRWPTLAFGGSSVRVLSNGRYGQRKSVTITGRGRGIQTGCGPLGSTVASTSKSVGDGHGRNFGVLRYGPAMAEEYRTERDS